MSTMKTVRVCQICPKSSKSLGQKLLFGKSSPYAGGKGTIFPFMETSMEKELPPGAKTYAKKVIFSIR